jgi:hypothetical protein
MQGVYLKVSFYLNSPRQIEQDISALESNK